jgi:hypothetical protein
MTNEELQQRTEQIIKSLGSFDDWKRGKVKNPFPIGRTYAYNLSRGKFDQCGKHGIAAMKEYFRELDLKKNLNKSFEQYDQVYKNVKTNKDV